ncbi:hypothetical protein TNIN_299981 [Trichonephila inaurata madagascariensis]|uniref:Uncharacterized protein n=1 Tax=Trichonephila inaurata madagascariensis TaxID=2747483 RepID=A0A8X7C1G8_9ARAC|nr:hypothetical protein TNIN_299981 [Trichonephila inaurata madagascariensis]
MIPQNEIHSVENVVSDDDEDDETEDLNDVAYQAEANVSQLFGLSSTLRQQDLSRCVGRSSKKEKCIKIHTTREVRKYLPSLSTRVLQPLCTLKALSGTYVLSQPIGGIV